MLGHTDASRDEERAKNCRPEPPVCEGRTRFFADSSAGFGIASRDRDAMIRCA
jgi:hypothetical protein